MYSGWKKAVVFGQQQSKQKLFLVVPLAETCWCSEVSLAFTVQLDLALWLCSSELGMWGWRSWSRGPAVLSDLMNLIPTLSSPYSSYTDNLELSRRWQQSPGLHCRENGWTYSWVLGWYITLALTAPTTLRYPCAHMCDLAPVVTHSPALGAVSHVPMARKLS